MPNKQLYEVEIEVNKRIVGSITISAESAEEAEDFASELIKLTGKKSYGKDTQETSQTTGTSTSEGPTGQTTN